MSSGKNPLMLMMALAMPGAAQAIGLGDIQVESRLNERLVAEIEIIGATPLELADLRAAIASRDTFVRYGVDRPAFLSSATFKVTHNSLGRPVLAVSSSDSFTEPLVNFLVDLRWRNGEFVREYTLLLDPPGYGQDAPAVEPAGIAPAAPASPAVSPGTPAAKPTVENRTQTVAQADSDGTERGSRRMTQIKVGARATLRGIAWRIGERSPSDLQRMMIAIFRANPAAFDGNINRLYLGAVLNIPSQADLESISREDARSEFHAQMEAWRTSNGGSKSVVAHQTASPAAATSASSSTAAGGGAAASAAPSASAAGQGLATSPEAEAQALGHRIESLEQELAAVKGMLDKENHQIEDLRQQELNPAQAPSGDAAATATSAAAAPLAAAVPAAAVAATAPPKAAPAAALAATVKTDDVPPDAPKPMHTSLVAAAAGLGTLGAALAALYFRLRRRKTAALDESEVGDRFTDTVIVAANDAPTVRLPALRAAEPLPQAVKPAWPEPELPADVPVPAAVLAAQTAPSDVGLDDVALERAIEAAAIYEATNPAPAFELESDEPVKATSPQPAPLPRASSVEDTIALAPVDTHADIGSTRVDTRLDYNLIDLDMTVQHVQMPSALDENAVVKERRTNLADVLKVALEREPNRDDLRMKLLELYYSAATLNRNGFLEVVQKLAESHPDYRQTENWEKITYMGRQILPESPLFLDELSIEEVVQAVRKVS
jgi:FimV-like protein